MRLVHLSRRVIPLAVGLASILFIFTAVATLWLLLWPPETTFNVVAETERVVMKATHQVPWRWTFDKAVLTQGSETADFSGSIRLGAPVEVAVERVGYGTLWIAVRHIADRDGTCASATLFGADEEAKGRTSCEFDILVPGIPERAAEGETVVLMLEGEISAGRPVGFQTQGTGTALLRSGRVTLRESTVLGTPYDAETKELDAGDFFSVGQVNPEIHPRGFVVADERPAMTAAFRIVGREGIVERPGGGESRIASDIVSRFSKDKLFRVLVALIAAILGLVTLGAAIVEGLDPRDAAAIATSEDRSPKASV